MTNRQRSGTISIHAPRAGCDSAVTSVPPILTYFNPRTPCGVRPADAVVSTSDFPYFNPRTPCGVRPPYRTTLCTACNFNPRTPCGVRQVPAAGARRVVAISIHAPRAGCDVADGAHRIQRGISIHAPRAGCDGIRQGRHLTVGQFQSTHPVRGATGCLAALCKVCFNFNPRTPCGVRRQI